MVGFKTSVPVSRSPIDLPVAECSKKTQPPTTVEAIAAEMGVCRKTLHRYYSRGCPRSTVSGAVQWRSENIKAAAQVTEASDVRLELRRAELEQTLETARSQRLKTDLLAGSLLARVDVPLDLMPKTPGKLHFCMKATQKATHLL